MITYVVLEATTFSGCTTPTAFAPSALGLFVDFLAILHPADLIQAASRA